ncbi:Ig-like domain-containing protein [Spirochaetota bacterium]
MNLNKKLLFTVSLFTFLSVGMMSCNYNGSSLKDDSEKFICGNSNPVSPNDNQEEILNSYYSTTRFKMYDCGTGSTSGTPDVPDTPDTIEIDIKPGNDENVINEEDNGVIPVAVLTTNTFNAADLDPSTITFAPGNAPVAHGEGHMEDVDGDGDIDLLLHFRTNEAGISCGQIEIFLSGKTYSGITLKGKDSVKLLHCPEGKDLENLENRCSNPVIIPSDNSEAGLWKNLTYTGGIGKIELKYLPSNPATSNWLVHAYGFCGGPDSGTYCDWRTKYGYRLDSGEIYVFWDHGFKTTEMRIRMLPGESKILEVYHVNVFAPGDGRRTYCMREYYRCTGDGCTVNPPVAVTGISLNKTDAIIEIGTSEQLMAAITPDNAVNRNVTWKSSDESIAAVSSDGLITGVMVGSVAITATTEDGSYTAHCDVIVSSPYVSVDEWIPTSTANDPSNRFYHTAVWTGKKMIVWGGRDNRINYMRNGGIYDPVSKTWSAISISNAPSARAFHTAVWTGSKMIVWGGGPYTNTGGVYNPSTNLWKTMSTAGAPHYRHTEPAVWTGKEMIIWGGAYSNGTRWVSLADGAKYNPVTNTWTAISTLNDPGARVNHSVVWTGTEMIIWGGGGDGPPLNTGAKYDPDSDTWTAISSTNAPAARTNHSAIWTGKEMIIWGGGYHDGTKWIFLSDGAKYNPVTDTWTTISSVNSPQHRIYHTVAWTDREMIVWGGLSAPGSPINTGGKYNPETDTWALTSTINAPSGRSGHTAVWTDFEMVVWGGFPENSIGGAYKP